MTRNQYRDMRRRVTISSRGGNYVVRYPILEGDLRNYHREEIFSQAIGANAYGRARAFAMAKAKELLAKVAA
jgi:hypothetical protein